MEKRNIYQLLLVNMLFITSSVYAQNDTIYQDEDMIEEVLEFTDDRDSHNYDDEISDLKEKFSDPVNINAVNKEQLQQFPFLSDIQIENVIAYLYQHGEMKSIYELQLVKEMDWQTIRYLIPFVCVKPIEKKNSFPSLHDCYRYGKNELITRLDIPFYRNEGYKNKYLGPPPYHSIKYSYRYKEQIYFGLTAEKDRGEPMFALYNRKGYDSYSTYLLIKDLGILKTLAIGDYRLSFGKGLVVSNNFLMGKSLYMSTLNRRNNSISKHSSTDEINFFRGVALSLALNKAMSLSSFISYRRHDGNIKEGEITSIHETGLHRTDKEEADRNTVGMLFCGSNLNYSYRKLQMGATGVYYMFNHPYMPAYREYNKYNLRGSSFYNFSIDYCYRYQRLSVSGETAAGRRGMATLNQLRYSPSQGYDILMCHRYYTHDYWAYYAHSFADGSMVQNENGWYIAANINPVKKTILFAAIDLVSFPWWKYRVSKPSALFDGMFRCTYLWNQRIKMDMNYRYRRRERDITGSKGNDIRPIYQHDIRWKMNYQVHDNFIMRTTADYKVFTQKDMETTRGYQFTQFIEYKSSLYPLDIVVQSSYFNTDNYDTRMFIYERSMLSSYYIPSYQGIGLHCSARIQYKLNRHWLFITHCSHTRFYNQQTIGSGSDKIDSNKKTELRLQLRMNF